MMQAGKYYVGDLCYVMHDRWDEVCDLLFPPGTTGRGLQGEFNLKDGTRFVLYSTAYGDGEYSDEQGRKYPVDAGVIGCIALDDIDEDFEGNDIYGGNIISFAKDFNTSTDGENITIGHVVVETGDDPYDDEEDEYEEEEEY